MPDLVAAPNISAGTSPDAVLAVLQATQTDHERRISITEERQDKLRELIEKKSDDQMNFMMNTKDNLTGGLLKLTLWIAGQFVATVAVLVGVVSLVVSHFGL